ncbi:MAG: adenylate/guanylate cyclase domain-containing protein [Acidimicrobiales bacterium]
MRCPACKEEAPEGKRFCANCGASLSVACASCGAEMIPGQRFCADCGAAAPAAPAAPAARNADPATAERRLCSVLFVDLVGFTPFAEKRDPEEVRELLSRYFDRARAIIEAYGGTLEKFIGDAVMAVWGAPTANEDDAERAVRAGLDVVASVAGLGRDAGHPDLRARGGIVTGEVAITVGKVAEGMVLGDTVNSASRVQSVAEPGTVLVDEATWRAASDAVVFEAVGDLTLKGKDETVAAWRALRVVGKRKGLGRSERLEPPFVGRDDEIRQVKDLLHATSREQRARLVSVTGVPGIGKSRLAWEFLKYVDGLAENVFWHQGRSASYGEGITFGALGEMVRMRAGINEAAGAEETRAQLRASVEEFVTDEEERRWIEPRLAYLLGLADAPPGERDELFSAWRTFFERISSLGPTVMAFEDLQWADPGLIDFIESILEWSRNYPIMVLTLSRPELLDLRPDWGAGQRSFTSLHLDALSDAAMRELLSGVVTGLPEEITERILQRAEGVPLYAVETLRMLMDRGVIVESDRGFVIAGDVTSLDIPETLQALVTSRLDALSAVQRALLQDAAVLGTSFLPESLSVVSGVERASVDAHLRDLVRREFLRFDTDPRSPERGQYGFVQGVIAGVALSMLSRRDLNAKHLTAARYYESFDDDELTAVVAAHYAAAFRSAPDADAAREISGDACRWLRRAGERALSLGSPDQALALAEQAVAIAPPGAEHASLLELVADAALYQGYRDRALSLAREAVEEYRGVGDETAAALATSKVSLVLRTMDRLEESVAVAQAAFERLGEGGDPRARAELAQNLARTKANSRDSSGALEWAERALTIAERIDNAPLFSGALGARSYALFNLGRHQEAVMLGRGRAEMAEASESLREQAEAKMALSLYCLPDDVQEAYRASLETAELGRRAGVRMMEETALLNAVETGIGLGKWSEVEPILDSIDARGTMERNVVWVALLRAMIAAWRGDLETAHTLVNLQLTSSYDTEFVAGKTTTLTSRAFVCYMAGQWREGLDLAAEAVELDPSGINSGAAIGHQARCAIWMKDPEEMRGALAAASRIRGRWMGAVRLEIEAALAALEGDGLDASDLYAAAVEAWRSLDCLLDVAITEVEALHLLGPGHPQTTLAKEAEDLLGEYGVPVLLGRLREALAG